MQLEDIERATRAPQTHADHPQVIAENAVRATMAIPHEQRTHDHQQALAKHAYEAYGRTTNFKNFRGEDMPKYEDLPQAIQNAWVSAAEAAKSFQG